ncbi:MAG TPA: family 1 glycosylhydrolase [Chthoniobacteraceae bacterium]|jgi:beta-glucosidase/6-phospho-beta-glucosidase/beta-galactosidase|nr:family 1 glycosylhydrolase [Chthoniobacteraceae bacterium]
MRSEFLWGVATSAYQSEGGYNGPGEPQTNWAGAEAKGDVAVAGATADFWHRYEEDFARCEALGLSAFRLGLEWSRIQPAVGHGSDQAGRAGQTGQPGQTGQTHESHDSPPPFDYAALDHYAKILTSCQQHGLEPVVTLHHFVHPAWLGTDPWLDPRTPERFVAYIREAVTYLTARLPRPLRWFITINEPNMLVLNSYLGRQFPARAKSGFATMTAAYNQLLRAHVLAYNALHDLYQEHGWETPRVSLNNYCSDVYWSDKLLLDLLCARERGVARHKVADYIVDCADRFTLAFRQARLPLHKDAAYYLGAAAKWVTNWLGRRQFCNSDFAPVLDALYNAPRARVLDYIGLDYYDPFAAHIFRLPAISDFEFRTKSLRNWVLTAVTSKWWDWRVLPRGLYFFCKYYAEDFGRLVLIAENGMALRRRPDNSASGRRDKLNRSDFLRLHVHEVNRARHDGVPIAGYLHWSLFDNYEWGSFTPRFGLYALDYTKGTERLVEDHTGDRPAETYAGLIGK